GVECLLVVFIARVVSVSVILPTDIGSTVVHVGANIAGRVARIQFTRATAVVESIVSDVLKIRIGIVNRRIRTQTACSTKGAGFLQTSDVVVLVSAIEPFVRRVP